MIDKESNFGALVTEFPESLVHGDGIWSGSPGTILNAAYRFFQASPVELSSISFVVHNALNVKVTVYDEINQEVFSQVNYIQKLDLRLSI